MSTSLVTTLTGKIFITKLDKIEFSTSDDNVEIVIEVAGSEILREEYTPDINGKITLYNVDTLLTPYVLNTLIAQVDLYYSSDDTSADDNDAVTFKAIYTSAVITQSTSVFLNTRFLTHLESEKITAIGRKEFLYLYVDQNITPTATAYYDDGTTQTGNYGSALTNYDTIVTLEVSANNFVVSGKKLLKYVIVAGQRVMNFIVEPQVEYSPCLIFRNSFGCQETIYCKGTSELEPKYEHTTALVEGNFRNVDIEETKVFKAYTGILNTEMSNWADELFRSSAINIFTVNQTTGVISIGREITITDAKAIRSNEQDYIPNFYFEYRYAQRNHNIFDEVKAGRVFDDTFDMTFE